MAEENQVNILNLPTEETNVATKQTLDLKLTAIADAISTMQGGVQTVNGKTGNVVLNKADIGLGSVDNTSDLNKPISTATQSALNDKLDKISSSNKVYGTDSSGNQTSFDKDSFGQVDDVKVNNVSVVTTKIANIDLTGKEDKSNKVTSISDSSSDIQYASAKAVYTKYKENKERIDNLEARGRFLSDWNSNTGMPLTNPPSLPYTYKPGDYYIVRTVTEGVTHYAPSGSTYNGNPSTTVETNTVEKDDTYMYDGTYWILQSTAKKTIGIDNVSGLRDELDSKIDLTQEADKIYGTNESGEQTIYDKEAFGKVDDVKIGTTSLVSSKIATIPIATHANLGVVRTNTSWGTFMSGEQIGVNKATDSEITSRTSSYKPIVPNNLDKAIMEGLGNNSLTWSSQYQTSARATIGAGTLSQVNIDNTSIVSGDTATIPFASNSQGGVVMVDSTLGVDTASDGKKLKMAVATQNMIDNRTSSSIAAITPDNIDYALKQALGNYNSTKGGAWTDTQKSSARSLIGAGTPLDVQISGTSIIENGVANIPYASTGVAGVVTIDSSNGIGIGASHQLYTERASEAELTAKSNGFKVIVPYTLDMAIREGLGNNSLTWSDAYKANARNTIGAGTPLDVQVNGTSVVADGVANIPIAGTRASQLGLVIYNSSYGVSVRTNGVLQVESSTETEIINKADQRKPVVPSNLDIAIREGLGNNSLTWTDTYKANARTTIGAGISSVTFVEWE